MPETQTASAPRTRSWIAAGSISFAAAFLLCGYEFVRSTSNTLYVDAYGAEQLTTIMAIVPVGVLLLVYAYAKILTRLGPRRTLAASSLLSGAAIAACYLAIRAESKIATGILYVIREAYIVILIEQYWSFLDSTLGHDSARTLNGPICGVASIGAILGGRLVGALSKSMGSSSMLLFAAASVIPAALCSDFAYRYCGEPAPKPEEQRVKHGELGLSLFREYSVLPLLLFIVLATQVVSTGLDLRFNTMLKEQIPDTDARNAYSGEFWSNVSLASAGLQFVVAPLVLRFLSVGLANLAIPLIHIAACIYLLLAPSLFSSAAVYLLFKSLDYSLFRAAKEMLYIPLPFDARYRAKEWIDVFGYRFGKGGASLALKFLQWSLQISARFYTSLALGAACVWLVLAVPISRHYKRNDLPQMNADNSG